MYERWEGIIEGRRTRMGTKRYMRNFAALGVTAALIVAFALLALPREAFAIVNQTVLCQGEITSSTDTTTPANAPPTGIDFSIGNVTVVKQAAHCATTSTTVTQVTQNTTPGTCNGQTPCVVTLTETNCVPLDTTGCVAANGCSVNKIPGTTISIITASSDPDLVGCQETSIANTYSGTTGSFTMTITPVGPGATTCKATLTGITACTSNLQ